MNNRRPVRKSSLESLEQRHLLAAASFSLQLYESGEEGPADEIVGPITAGESFYVEVSATEHDPLHRGIGGVALNLKWDPSLIALVEDDFDLSQILSDDLPLFRGGTYDQELGRIYDLRASQIEAMGAGRPVGDGQAASIAMLHFQSLGEISESEIRIWEGASGIVPSPYAHWRHGDIEFETQNLSVAAAIEQPLESEETVADDSGSESNVETTDDPASDDPDSDDRATFHVDSDSQAPESVDAFTLVEEAEEILETVDLIEPEHEEVVDEPLADSVPDHDPAGESFTGTTLGTTTAPQMNAESIDQVLSFDMNQDGIFDFGDFGLLNRSPQSPTTEAVDAAETESSFVTADEGVQEEPQLDFHVVCIAAPPRTDVAGFERWLDALAAAWIADAKAREIRRDERLASDLNTPSVLS